MQPARADVVQNFTLPGSAATAIVRRGAIRSLPWWVPLYLAAPKSFVNATAPTIGKMRRGTAPDGAAETTPVRPIAVTATAATMSPRAVVRREATYRSSRSEAKTLAGPIGS